MENEVRSRLEEISIINIRKIIRLHNLQSHIEMTQLKPGLIKSIIDHFNPKIKGNNLELNTTTNIPLDAPLTRGAKKAKRDKGEPISRASSQSQSKAGTPTIEDRRNDKVIPISVSRANSLSKSEVVVTPDIDKKAVAKATKATKDAKEIVDEAKKKTEKADNKIMEDAEKEKKKADDKIMEEAVKKAKKSDKAIMEEAEKKAKSKNVDKETMIDARKKAGTWVWTQEELELRDKEEYPIYPIEFEIAKLFKLYRSGKDIKGKVMSEDKRERLFDYIGELEQVGTESDGEERIELSDDDMSDIYSSDEEEEEEELYKELVVTEFVWNNMRYLGDERSGDVYDVVTEKFMPGYKWNFDTKTMTVDPYKITSILPQKSASDFKADSKTPRVEESPLSKQEKEERAKGNFRIEEYNHRGLLYLVDPETGDVYNYIKPHDKLYGYKYNREYKDMKEPKNKLYLQKRKDVVSASEQQRRHSDAPYTPLTVYLSRNREDSTQGKAYLKREKELADLRSATKNAREALTPEEEAKRKEALVAPFKKWHIEKAAKKKVILDAREAKKKAEKEAKEKVILDAKEAKKAAKEAKEMKEGVKRANVAMSRK